MLLRLFYELFQHRRNEAFPRTELLIKQVRKYHVFTDLQAGGKVKRGIRCPHQLPQNTPVKVCFPTDATGRHKHLQLCSMWVFHDGGCEESRLLGCDVVWVLQELTLTLLFTWMFLPCRRRRNVLPKRRYFTDSAIHLRRRHSSSSAICQQCILQSEASSI
jgi:hypothetical protein